MKVFLSPDHLVLEPPAEGVPRLTVLPREHLKARVEQEKLVSEEDSAEALEAEIEMRE